MQSGPALGPGSLISERGRVLDLVFQDAFYAVYSAEAAGSGAPIGITEYFPADLATRAPGGEVIVRSLDLQDLFKLGRDRFIAEAKALSALRHPNLLRFDGVASDHGAAVAFHAPEAGQSITTLVKSSKQRPPQEEIDTCLTQVISALDLLHSNNLMHANITPDTLLLRPEPLLIRFGAARSFLAARMCKVNLAATPGYSAPELYFTDEKAHGPLCDIFSLAAVLYFMVTGRHPINVIARGLGQTMPPAAAAPSGSYRAEFLEAIDRGLELDPGRRPPTIKAFGEMLLGSEERNASASPQPASQPAAELQEDSQVLAPSCVAPPNGVSSTAGAVPNGWAHGLNGDTEVDEEDKFDSAWDFGSRWREPGLASLLVAVAALALLVFAGLWMIEAQFKNRPGQSAGSGKDAIAALQAQPAQKPDAAHEKPQPKSAPQAETAGQEAPPRVAKAEPLPAPLAGASASSPPGFIFKDCEGCPALVVAPKGEFTMGSSENPHEKPAHTVRIAHPFAIGRYEVTLEEWNRCVDAGACRYRPDHRGSPKEPAGNLNWDDANAYVKWLSEKTGQVYRLPSEAEWEYAARAGTAKRFWWGDEAGFGKANCSDCGSGTDGQPAAAGSYQPNPFGLYDTSGNMAEWVEDCWNDSYRGAPADGSAWTKGDCSLRGLRGGSYGNKAAFSRSASRFRYDSDVRYEANGFRVLRELR